MSDETSNEKREKRGVGRPKGARSARYPVVWPVGMTQEMRARIESLFSASEAPSRSALMRLLIEVGLENMNSHKVREHFDGEPRHHRSQGPHQRRQW